MSPCTKIYRVVQYSYLIGRSNNIKDGVSSAQSFSDTASGFARTTKMSMISGNFSLKTMQMQCVEMFIKGRGLVPEEHINHEINWFFEY